MIVPADHLAYLANGEIKPAERLQVGDTVYMTGDKTGVIQSVETKLYTPTSTQTDGNGNSYQRILAKSKRFAETLLHLHVAGEVIKTTPEHPFYVNGTWVEAQHLSAGAQIRTQNGATLSVDRIEQVHEPQFVYSLQVEGAQNFYVGEGGLLAHNCAPTLQTARVLSTLITGSLDPKSIRFTQDSIKADFKDGRALQDTITALKSGTLSADSFPAIRVFEVGGQMFTLDNRRLYVFQQAGVSIRAVPATAQEIANESFKFTTKNGGTSIVVRGSQ